MATTQPHPQDDRAHRALTDIIAVEQYAPGMAKVTSWSDEYIIDLRGDGCACPDKEYNDVPKCKHEYSALLAMGDAMPNPYVTETRERTTAADGGQRPTDCECSGLDGDLPCFACYRAGFEEASA
jgi:hypothetical protein